MLCQTGKPRSSSSQTGFTLLEVLIASLITTVGLLGVFQLHTQAKRNSFESFNYASASALVADIIDRIRLNPTELNNYLGTDFGQGNQPVPSTQCTMSGGAIVNCTEAQMTAWDRYQWDQLLMGSSQTREGRQVGAANSLIGCVYRNGELITVVVAWHGLEQISTSGGSGFTCGDDGQFQRRIEMTTMITSDL